MNSQTLPARVVSIVSNLFNSNNKRTIRSGPAEALGTFVLIVIFGLLLALFGKGEIVSSQVEKLPPLNELLGGAINPGGVTGQSLWVKADGGLLFNGSDQVEQWLDQSGSGNTTTELRASLPAHTNAIAPSNAILRVANGINFNPAVDFSGAVGRSLKGNALTQWDATPISIFTVALPEGATVGGFGGVFSGHADWTTTSSAGIGLDIIPGGSYGLDGSGCIVALTTSSTAEPRVVRGIYTTGANALGGSTWLNGVQEATGTNCATNATTLFEVGGRTAGTTTFDNRIFNGKITEVVVYKSVLTAANANKVESYLAIKYGITLRQTPPKNYTDSAGLVVWDAAINPIHNKNIAGIGRDDLSGLSQKQSRSVNIASSGNLVTVGHGTIAADNASNSNGFGVDKDFLIWGDDGASGSFGTPITPPLGVTATVRMTRVWKTQETGTVGTVKVGIPSSLGGGNTVYLVVSNDTTFDAGDQYIPMTPLTAGSTTYQAADFDFVSGQFFTFASVPTIPGGVGGMALWLKGDAGMNCETDTCTVTQWQDQSPNGKDAAGTAGTLSRKNVGVNFNPALGFDATDAMRGTSLMGASTLSNANIYFVSKKTTIGATSDFYEFNSINTAGNGGLGIHVPFTNNLAIWDAGVNNANNRLTAPVGTIVLGQYELKSFNASTTLAQTIAGARQAISKNGGVITTDTTLANFTGGNKPYQLGGATLDTTGGAEVPDGVEDIAEVIVFTSAITGAEQQRIHSYLALKYGITLDQTAPQNYVASDGTTISWDATANLIYNRNITGIGRDDVSGLDQKQSRSINLPNSGNLVTIGLGTIETENVLNSNAFAADKNFLTWGDDGAGAGFTTLITPPLGIMATVRLTRIWKVQETGTIPTVKIGIPANLGGGNIVYLVVSGDTTFDASDQYFPMTPLTAGNTTYQAADFDFTTGQFFTFATLPAIPGGVAAPVTWQKANDGAPTGALWDDSSAGGNDAAQGTAASQPTFVPGSDPTGAINFNPGFDFDGVNDFLDFPTSLGIGGLADSSSFFVWKQDAAAGGVILGDDGTPGANQFLLAVGGTIPGNFRSSVGHGGTPCGVATTTALPLNRPGIGAAVRASSNMTVRLDGGGAATGPCASPFTSNPRRLAAREDGFLAAIIGEFIEYDRALSANEQQRVWSYLAVKYGITLDQTAPTSYLASDSTVIWDSAVNAVYNDDITGIGRDDVSALNQKQSASVNAGNFVTIGHGGIAPDNETNPNSFPANKDFLIWGHDAGTTAFNVQVIGSANVRMARIWKVQETAGIPPAPAPEAVINVVVRVPQSLFTNPFPVLARSTDSTFEATDEFIPMTANGTDYEATIDFANGDFFTFAQLVTPTAANVSISGRILTADGRGIRSTVVVLADSEGNSRTATTSSFGYYRFDDVPAGETYVMSVSSKRYQFEPRVVNVQDEIANLDFIAQE
jgi:hypothetical protein